MEILVAGKPVTLNLHYPGDSLFDERWATMLLEARVADTQGFYRPGEEERYWLLAHNSVARLEPVDRRLLADFRSMAADQHLLGASELSGNDDELKALLADELIRRGVWQPGYASKLGAVMNTRVSELAQKYHLLTAIMRTHYLTARDTILYHLPIFSVIKRSLKALASGS